MKKFIIAALAISATCSISTNAQDVPTYNIVYTPNRIAEKKSATLANISVITQEEIEQKQFQSLEEALNTLPGVSIAKNGGHGTLSSLFYRGTESDHTIVLVDGVRLVSLSSGAPNLSIIPISMIERIEAVSGANSSIYGADAIGGVIQIFTKKAQKGKTLTNLQLSAGSKNTKALSANISSSSKNDNAWISINSAFDKSHGFDTCDNSGTGGCYVNEPDADGFRNKALSVTAGTKFADDRAKLSVSALNSGDDVEFDGSIYSGNQAQNRQQNISTTLEIQPTEKLDINLSYAESRNKSHNEFNKNFVSNYTSKRKTSSLIGSYAFNDAVKLILGSDFVHEALDSSENYGENARHSKGVFALGSYKLNNTTIEGSYRLDDHSTYAKEKTGGLSIAQDIKGLKIIASHKKAFHAPTFNELYYPFGSNPNLAPETSYSNELSFRGTVKNVSTNLSFYRTRIEDLIANDASFTPQNIKTARIRGVSLDSTAHFGNTNIDASVNAMSAKDKTTHQDLARRPSLKASLGATHKINKILLGTQVTTQNHFYEPTQKRIGGFTTFDATAQYIMSPQLTVGCKVDNLTNKTYETADFYNQPGREYSIFVRYNGMR